MEKGGMDWDSGEGIGADGPLANRNRKERWKDGKGREGKGREGRGKEMG